MLGLFTPELEIRLARKATTRQDEEFLRIARASATLKILSNTFQSTDILYHVLNLISIK